MAFSEDRIVELVVRSVCLLATLTALARNAQLRQLPRRALAAIRPVVKRILTRQRKVAEGDEAESLARSRLQELRLEHFRWGCFIVALASTPVNAYMVCTATRHQQASDPLDQALRLMYIGIFSLVTMCPGIISAKTVDIAYGLMSVDIALLASPLVRGPDNFLYFAIGFNLMMICFNMFRRSLRASLVFNLLFAAGVSSTWLIHGHSISSNPYRMIFIQLLAALFFPFCAQFLDDGMRMSVCQGLKMRAIQELLEAACALLRSYCEVVVELDASGTIVDDASDLGCFLLQGPDRSFRGRVLADLIAEAWDRDTFLERLRSPAPSQGLAQAIHVRMRDANRELVKVELLWFGFRHLDGQQRFMLGLREWNEQTASGAPPQRHLRTEANEDAPKDATGSAPLRPPPALRPLPTEDVATMSSHSTETLLAIATVDSTTHGLPIRFCSEGFRSRIGRLKPGFHLASLLQDGASFVNWVHFGVNQAIVLAEREESGDDAEEPGDGIDHWGDVTNLPEYKTTFMLRRGELDATCKLVLRAGEPADLSHIEVLFSSIKWGHDHRRQPRERRGPPTTDRSRGTPTTRMSL